MKRIFQAFLIAILGMFYNVKINSRRGKVKTNIKGWKSKLVWLLTPFYDVRYNAKGEVYLQLKKHNNQDLVKKGKL